MKKLIQDWFTESDGTSWCIGRAMGFAAFLALVGKFCVTIPPDYISMAGGVAAIIAAIAAKNLSERKGNDPTN